MAKRRIGIIVFLLCFCFCLTNCTILAVSTADAKEPISTDEKCNLTIFYGYNGTHFQNQNVKLYKIADVSSDFQYSLTPSFASSGLVLNGIQTNGEWNVIRSTLEALILANNIQPNEIAKTNESGQACFTQLTTGLYFASAVEVAQDDMTCCFESVLVSLPTLDESGIWQYQVAVSAKPAILPPVRPNEEIQLKVLKLWKGDEGLSDRPKSVEVEIFKSGEKYKTITLSEENNWSFSWTVKDDGSNWKVIERNVPKGYTMTVEERETAFVLTNTLTIDPPETPPQTGYDSNILLYIIMMIISGSVLVILGVTGKRKSA